MSIATSLPRVRPTPDAHGGGCACGGEVPGAVVIGELVPRRERTLEVR